MSTEQDFDAMADAIQRAERLGKLDIGMFQGTSYQHREMRDAIIVARAFLRIANSKVVRDAD